MKQIVLLSLLWSALAVAGDKRPLINAGSLYDIIPQIAAGGGWKTTFMIANLEETKPVTWSLKFFAPDGKPMSVPIVGMGRNSVFGGVLNIHGSIIVETEDTGNLVEGWAKLESSGADDVGAVVIFRQRIAGRPDFEAVVPVSFSIDYEFVLPFDNTNGYVTAVAWVNPSQYGDTVFDAEVFDESGNLIGTDRIRLAPGQRQAFSLPERLPATAGRRGTIAPKLDLDYLSALGLRFSPSGSFTSVHTLSR
jgi:hypothetical protein